MSVKLNKLIKENIRLLNNSEKNLKTVFDITFNKKNEILCESNDGFKIKKYTYGEVETMVHSLSGALYEKIGAKGIYIALDMENCVEWIVSFWAILLSGNKPYLVNTRYPVSLSDSILKTLKAEYILCLDATSLDGIALSYRSLSSDKKVPDNVCEDEIAFSSSATSMNEVVCFYKGEQIINQILNFKSIIKKCPRIKKHYKGALKQLAFLPFYHIFGLFAVYFWFTFFNRTLVFLKDFSADTIIRTCKRHNVTHIFAVPILWHTVEKEVNATLKEMGEKKERKFQKGIKLCTSIQNVFPNSGAFLSKKIMKEVTDKLFGNSLLFCINGGGYLRDSAIKLFNGLGYSMHNGFGMSEVGITSVELRSKPKFLNLNSIGQPFDSVEYKLDNEGILHIKGSSLCTRKLINSKEVILDDWFSTGDIMEEKDGYYYIKGRKSDIVIGENGENVNPDTVEKQFNISGITNFSVLGIEDNDEELLSLVIEIPPYLSQEKIDKIIKDIYLQNDTLPKTMSVKRFYFTTDPLMNEMAIKVSRKQLTNAIKEGTLRLIPFADFKAMTKSNTNDDSPLMLKVRQIIANQLKTDIEKVKSDTHIFFDLGATSIQYFSILTSLAEEFSLSADQKEQEFSYTPKEICDYIERHI